MKYKINKKTGKLTYGPHDLGIFKDGYISFSKDLEYSIDDLKNIVKLLDLD